VTKKNNKHKLKRKADKKKTKIQVSKVKINPDDRMLYFAYGSNLSISQMKRRCPGSKLVRKGMLKGHKIDFTRYSVGWSGGVADVIKDHRENVWGLIYSLSYKDLKKLDGYEGYPTCYNRKLVTIHSINSQLTKNVWVYYVTKKGNYSAPSKKYLGIIKGAAHNYNFPKYYCETLRAVVPRAKENIKTNYRNLLLNNNKPILKSKKSDIIHLPSQQKTYLFDDEFNDDEDTEDKDEFLGLNFDDIDNMWYD